MAQIAYRPMERAAADRQFNLRARWPEHAAYFERWARDSAAVRARLGVQSAARLDLAYDGAPGCKLDFFGSRNDRAPLLAFIHGGYWQSLDKGDFSYLAPPFVEAGIAFASLNYDLAPAVRIGEIAAQIGAALTWLRGNAQDLGFDPGRLFLAGHSAGGHLAVMAADLPGRPVKGICSVSGVYDLRPLRDSYHQDVLHLSEAEAEALSPLLHLPSRSGPLICAVGSQETEAFLAQQDDLIAAWRAAGLRATGVGLPGRQHFSAIDALGESDHPLFQAVRDMIESG